MTSIWGSCAKNLPNVWPGLAYRVNPGWLGPLQETGDAPTAVLPHGPIPIQLGLGGWSWPSDHEKTTQQDEWGQEGNVPILGVGIGSGGARAPPSQHPSQHQSPSPSPHDPILLMSGWAGPLKIPPSWGGTQPKVPAKPFTAPLRYHSRPKGGLDPVNLLHQWVLVELNRIRSHPHWWKKIRCGGRISMGECILREFFANAEALHYAQWQAAAFRVPLAQHEASGWWDAPLWLSGLCPKDFMPHTNASSSKDLQTVRQEKILAFSHALEACTERSGVSTGVLCISTRELQRCIAPLMCLSGDEIEEATLLEPVGEEYRTSPTPEEKAPSWVRSLSCYIPLRPHSSQNAQKSPNPQSPQSRLMLSLQNPPSKLMLLVPLLLHSPCPHLATTLPRR